MRARPLGKQVRIKCACCVARPPRQHAVPASHDSVGSQPMPFSRFMACEKNLSMLSRCRARARDCLLRSSGGASARGRPSPIHLPRHTSLAALAAPVTASWRPCPSCVLCFLRMCPVVKTQTARGKLVAVIRENSWLGDNLTFSTAKAHTGGILVPAEMVNAGAGSLIGLPLLCKRRDNRYRIP